MKKRLAGIARHIGQDTVVRINRKPIDDFTLDGFVVGVSEKLLCLHIVDGKTLMLNGYAVMRLSDIRSYNVDEVSFVDRALRLLGRQPVIPSDLDLSHWPALLASLRTHYLLITIYREKEAPVCCYPGQVAKVTTRYVDLDYVNPAGHWDGSERSLFKDVTLIEFGDGYANALTSLLTHEADG